MGDIVAVYTLSGTINGNPVTKVVYVLNGTLDADCPEIFSFSDGSDGTDWIETSGGGGGGGLAPTTLVASGIISSAEILNSGVVFPELLPAPGVGFTYDLISAVMKYNFGTIPYIFPAQTGVRFNGLPFYSIPIVGAALSGIVSTALALNVQAPGFLDIENKSVVFASTPGNPLNGDGTIFYSIHYRLVALV